MTGIVDGRVVIVTGAGRGIGREIALLLNAASSAQAGPGRAAPAA